MTAATATTGEHSATFDVRRATNALLPLVGLTVALAAFEIASRSGLLDSTRFPPVSEIFVALFRLARTAAYWSVVWETLSGWAVAMLLASLIAIPLGLFIGASRLGYLMTKFTIDFLRPIPSVALIPMLVLVYGTQPSLKVTLAVIGATFPLLFQAMYGVRDVDPVAKETARSFGLNPLQRVGRIVLPSCLPFVVTGMRISSSIALILVVTGELIVGINGIGEQVLLTESGGAYDRMYAYVVTAGLLGLALNAVLQGAERKVLFWHASQRERQP